MEFRVKKLVIAVQLNKKHQIKRVYIKFIDVNSAKSLTPTPEEPIRKIA